MQIKLVLRSYLIIVNIFRDLKLLKNKKGCFYLYRIKFQRLLILEFYIINYSQAGAYAMQLILQFDE